MIIVAGCTISPQKDPLPKLVKGFFVLGIDRIKIGMLLLKPLDLNE